MAHLTNFSFEFFMKFSQKTPLNVFYTMVQKVKNDQKLKSRGILPSNRHCRCCARKEHGVLFVHCGLNNRITGRSSYRVGLRAQANFSAQTFKPAHKARAGQRAALSATAAMQHLEQRSASELSAKWVAKNVIDFFFNLPGRSKSST